MKRLICWLKRHQLKSIRKSKDGSLEAVFCLRCKRTFAMYHPSEYFGEWDWQDTDCLNTLDALYVGDRK